MSVPCLGRYVIVTFKAGSLGYTVLPGLQRAIHSVNSQIHLQHGITVFVAILRSLRQIQLQELIRTDTKVYARNELFIESFAIDRVDRKTAQ